MVVLIKPEIQTPLEGWSWYGANQVLEIAGVPFSEISPEDKNAIANASVVIVPNAARPKLLSELAKEALQASKVVIVGSEVALAMMQDGVETGVLPALPIPLPPTEPSDLLRLTAYAMLPSAFMETALPLLGEPLVLAASRTPLGTVLTLDGKQGALVWVKHIGSGVLIGIGGRIFETCGLLLSRFSWLSHPHRRDSFLKRIDPLWDEQLTHWHRLPIVSLYARYLTWLLSAVLWERGELLLLRWCLPHQEGTPFRIGSTVLHDVEIVFDNPSWKRANNPCYCFPRWRDLEDQLGVRSAFFFLSPVTALPPHRQLNYDLTDEAIIKAMDLIDRFGGEIGLLSIAHASESALAMEREWLEDFGGVFVCGVRNYRFGNTPSSARHKFSVGFVYDASWFAGQSEPSFLTGSAHPFRPLDTEQWKVLPLLELSAVLDDRVLFGEFAQHTRSNEEATQLGTLFSETVLALNGVLCLSWQQHAFSVMSERVGSWVPAFEQLIRHLRQISDEAIWYPAPREIADWWTLRNDVHLSAQKVGDEQWQVKAELPEEATEAIAFVLAIPAPQPIQVRSETQSLVVQSLAPLGRGILWGVPLTLEPEEPMQLKVQLALSR